MYLVVTATEMEMAPIARALAGLSGWTSLVAGIGLLETAITLTRFLEANSNAIHGVINCGVAGAFPGAGPQLLDICLAETENLAEAGICFDDGAHPFDTMELPTMFPLDKTLRDHALTALTHDGFKPWSGPFVSVLGVSGTLNRGKALQKRFSAICENMEGVAVARTARAFHLPCLELRAVSNMVEDRNLKAWRLSEAVDCCAKAMACLLPNLPL